MPFFHNNTSKSLPKHKQLMVVEKKSQIRQDELDSRYVTVYLCSSEKKIVRDFHHMEKDFGDLTINIYL